jgi:hypothetical protein
MHTTRLSLLGLSVRVSPFLLFLVSYYYFKEHVTSSVDLSVEERMSFGMRAPTASLRAEYVLIVTGYSPK